MEPEHVQYCRECREQTVVVFDRSSGDVICSACGLVLEERFINDGSESRNIKEDINPVSIDNLVDPFLSDRGLTTILEKTSVSHCNRFPELRKLKDQVSREQSFKEALSKLSDMADRLDLVNILKDRANEVYKKVEDLKLTTGRNQDDILAACLYMACRQENKPRSIKEVYSVVSRGIEMKDIGRAKEAIVKKLAEELGETMEVGSIHAHDFARRYCSNLAMNNNAVNAVEEAMKKSEELDIRRRPTTIVAAIIYMITQISDEIKPLEDIAVATGVSVGTIRSAYKDPHQYAARLIPTSPTGYIKEDDIKNLPDP